VPGVLAMRVCRRQRFPFTAMTATEIRSHLEALHEERAAALAWGADAIPSYMESLQQEIADYRAAYVGAAVTEIASFRAALSGPQVG
jgi:hypothetical protein